MDTKHIIFLIIGILVLIVFQLIRNLIEKVKLSFTLLPPVFKERMSAPEREARIKKYYEEKLEKDNQDQTKDNKNISNKKTTIKELGLGEFMPVVPSVFHLVIIIAILIFISGFIIYFYAISITSSPIIKSS